jgi:hypothetical protein
LAEALARGLEHARVADVERHALGGQKALDERDAADKGKQLPPATARIA